MASNSKKKRLFEQILSDARADGIVPDRTTKSKEWFINRANSIEEVSNLDLIYSYKNDRATTFPKIGEMFMFFYDPKYRHKLPYWDTFPLVFPIEWTETGFLGLNLHYLPLIERAKLMDNLLQITNNIILNERTHLNVSYGILKATSKFKIAKPCLKQYRFDHVRSRFTVVYSNEWHIAAFLPLARFEGGNETTVYSDSINKLR